MSSLKSKADKLNLGKLVPAPIDLSELSDLVKNVVKKEVYNAQIKNIIDFVLIMNINNILIIKYLILLILLNITNITDIVDITNIDITKINEVKGEIPSKTDFDTAAALPAVEDKIANVSNLVKKTDYNTKINEIEKQVTDHDHSNKYITTPEFNKLTSKYFDAKLKQTNLASKNDIANFVNETDFDKL